MRTSTLARLSGLLLFSSVPVVAVSLLAAQPGAPQGPAPQTTARQTAAPQPPAPEAPQGPLRLRIGVTAVEIDAVVTGKGNRPVTDLRPEEFEILQDGRRQTVISAQYIPLDPPDSSSSADASAAATPARAAAPPPARAPRREDVRRTMAIIVDDLNLSFISVARVRHALRTFISQELHPGDLVTVVPTGRGVGSVQPFTADKRMLLETASRLRYNMMTMAFTDTSGYESLGGAGPLDTIESLQADVLTAGSLGAMSAVIRSMRDMPGRKSVLLVSDGWSQIAFPRPGDPITGARLMSAGFPRIQPRITAAMQRLVDEANRSFVVIYTLDARGLIAPDLHLDGDQGASATAAATDAMAIFESQSGPQALASLAGGLFFRNNNNLAGMMARAMEDQRGYYLIGYQPDEATFAREQDRARFHAVKVRVARKGVKVRARTGFFGVTDEELAPKPPRSREERLLLAISQPFASSDIALQANSLFWRHPTHGPMVRTLVHVDTRTLSFRPDATGRPAAPLELASALIDDRGAVVRHRLLSLTVRAKSSAADTRDAGFVYAIDLPVSEPGPYQLRTAVRDVQADRLGSTSEFVIVPDTRDKRLALSGVMLAGALLGDMVATDAATFSAAPATPVGERTAAPDWLSITRPDTADPARRRFVPGMAVDYAFQVYNAERDRATGRPALTSSFRLFQDGTLVEDGTLTPETKDAGGETLAKRKTALSTGRFTLSDRLQPGAYDLEVAVTDTLGKKNRPAVQWTNFTVSPH